jgi:hypothetical protein
MTSQWNPTQAKHAFSSSPLLSPWSDCRWIPQQRGGLGRRWCPAELFSHTGEESAIEQKDGLKLYSGTEDLCASG